MDLRNVIHRFRNRDQLFKQMQDEDAASTKVQQRKLSSEERALNKIYEQRRQDAIKRELSKINKQEQHDFWHKDVITQKNLFRGNKNLFAQRRYS